MKEMIAVIFDGLISIERLEASPGRCGATKKQYDNGMTSRSTDARRTPAGRRSSPTTGCW